MLLKFEAEASLIKLRRFHFFLECITRIWELILPVEQAYSNATVATDLMHLAVTEESAIYNSETTAIE